jgi:formylglycine-generating enzyme
VALLLVPLWTRAGEAAGGPCPPDMANIGDAYCIDKWEASLVESRSGKSVSPYKNPGETKVRAVSKSGAVPQAYISKTEAEAACKNAKKRLCKEAEWVKACQGKSPTKYPYGDEHHEGYCNDAGKAPLATYYPDGNAYSSNQAMNDPRLNQLPGTVSRTGRHKKCRNSYGVYDMVGNVHEWVDDPNGTFRGGYYLDTKQNGEGCKYRTDAHDVSYHDYSTGFRCCKDPK